MFTLRRGADRGATRVGWLDARHSFSFGDYYDPAHHHYRALRVLNDDRVAPGGGFDTHGHRDMEILTTVLSGALQHRDSMGNGEVIRPGEWQAMTAGTGILHSEFNPSETEPTHLLQIWLVPDRKGHTPGYRQRAFPPAGDRWQLVASPDGADGSLAIHQDARVYEARLSPGATVRHDLAAGRGAYLHVAEGSVDAHGHALTAGDALKADAEPHVALTATTAATVLLFDLA
jgi:redox-sensitive bicupin YhaK (pirin superfamily)